MAPFKAFVFPSSMPQPAQTRFASEVYHYQHLCEQTGYMAVGEYTEVRITAQRRCVGGGQSM
jgi:hypothetical protein